MWLTLLGLMVLGISATTIVLLAVGGSGGAQSVEPPCVSGIGNPLLQTAELRYCSPFFQLCDDKHWAVRHDHNAAQHSNLCPTPSVCCISTPQLSVNHTTPIFPQVYSVCQNGSLNLSPPTQASLLLDTIFRPTAVSLEDAAHRFHCCPTLLGVIPPSVAWIVMNGVVGSLFGILINVFNNYLIKTRCYDGLVITWKARLHAWWVSSNSAPTPTPISSSDEPDATQGEATAVNHQVEGDGVSVVTSIGTGSTKEISYKPFMFEKLNYGDVIFTGLWWEEHLPSVLMVKQNGRQYFLDVRCIIDAAGHGAVPVRPIGYDRVIVYEEYTTVVQGHKDKADGSSPGFQCLFVNHGGGLWSNVTLESVVFPLPPDDIKVQRYAVTECNASALNNKYSKQFRHRRAFLSTDKTQLFVSVRDGVASVNLGTRLTEFAITHTPKKNHDGKDFDPESYSRDPNDFPSLIPSPDGKFLVVVGDFMVNLVSVKRAEGLKVVGKPTDYSTFCYDSLGYPRGHFPKPCVLLQWPLIALTDKHQLKIVRVHTEVGNPEEKREEGSASSSCCCTIESVSGMGGLIVSMAVLANHPNILLIAVDNKLIMWDWQLCTRVGETLCFGTRVVESVACVTVQSPGQQQAENHVAVAFEVGSVEISIFFFKLHTTTTTTSASAAGVRLPSYCRPDLEQYKNIERRRMKAHADLPWTVRLITPSSLFVVKCIVSLVLGLVVTVIHIAKTSSSSSSGQGITGFQSYNSFAVMLINSAAMKSFIDFSTLFVLASGERMLQDFDGLIGLGHTVAFTNWNRTGWIDQMFRVFLGISVLMMSWVMMVECMGLGIAYEFLRHLLYKEKLSLPFGGGDPGADAILASIYIAVCSVVMLPVLLTHWLPGFILFIPWHMMVLWTFATVVYVGLVVLSCITFWFLKNFWPVVLKGRVDKEGGPTEFTPINSINDDGRSEEVRPLVADIAPAVGTTSPDSTCLQGKTKMVPVEENSSDDITSNHTAWTVYQVFRLILGIMVSSILGTYITSLPVNYAALVYSEGGSRYLSPSGYLEVPFVEFFARSSSCLLLQSALSAHDAINVVVRLF